MILFHGDIHGKTMPLQRLINAGRIVPGDTVVLLGDVGLNFYLDEREAFKKEALENSGIDFLCVHGNHERRPATIPSYSIEEWRGGEVFVEKAYPHIRFAKDGSVFDLDGHSAIVIGGAYSVDKHYRLMMGWPWFPDEQPSSEIKKAVEDRLDELGWKVDIVLSHTCPTKYIPREKFISSVDQRYVDSSTEEWLDRIEDRLDYSAWYCGHYHTNLWIDRMHFLYDCLEHLYDMSITDFKKERERIKMRKLASIQRIWKIEPIPGADRIELAHVLGWQCVVNKGQFKPMDAAVYFEIDSFLPIRPEFEFLRQSSYKKTDIMGEGFKLRTMRFKGQISQGLLLPVSQFPEIPGGLDIGADVTELLGVRKLEIEEKATTGGTVIGTLPYDIPHTDETRVQEEPELIQAFAGLEYYISTKMDGSSHSIGIDENGFHVTGHNYEYKDDGASSFYEACEDTRLSGEIGGFCAGERAEYPDDTGRALCSGHTAEQAPAAQARMVRLYRQGKRQTGRAQQNARGL